MDEKAGPKTPPKRRTKVLYVRVELSVAEEMAAVAERFGTSLSRTWERAGERYLVEHFGREEIRAPGLP